MKIFAKPLVSWTEPWFFVARVRGWQGWIVRGASFLTIFLGMLCAWYADQKWGRGPRFTPTEGVLLSLFIGVLLTSILDFANGRRLVSINDDGISVIGHAGPYFSVGLWKLSDISLAHLARPEEVG